MRVVNQCDNSILINDIDLIIPFSSTGEEFEIDPDLVERSTIIHICLAKKMIVDASKEKGVPGAYTRQQAMLSSEDQYRYPDNVPKPKHDLKAKKESFPEDETYALWHGPAFDFGGYANMNRRFMFGLSDMGDKIRYKELPSMKDAGSEIAQRLSNLTRTKVPEWAPMVYGMTAPLCYHWEKYKMLFTMMETRALHPHYVERCNSADEIIVPSHWCKNVFEESGVTKPMRVVPLGVDTSLYVPGAKPIGFSKGLKDFVFLSVFGWSMRKGYDVLLKAYFEEFTSDDPVSLFIMSRYKGSTDEHQKKVIREDIDRMAAMVSNPKKPHVILFGDTLSDEMMPRLYAAADCYVLISRGEGFGLPYCEAAACGLPVIASRYSGQTDFLDDDNSYLVDVDGFRKAARDLSWISYFYEDAEFPTLGASAVEQTRVHMRDVFENRDKAEEKAQKLRGHIVKNFDWSVGIQKMHNRLRELNDERRPR